MNCFHVSLDFNLSPYIKARAKPHLGLAAHPMFAGASLGALGQSIDNTQVHLGQSDLDMPAHLGFALTTSFMFDTRPEPPLFTASVALDDLVLGCLVVSLKAGNVGCARGAFGGCLRYIIRAVLLGV